MFKQIELTSIVGGRSPCAIRPRVAATVGEFSARRRNVGWLASLRVLACLALMLGTPAALAADLQISDLSDTGYDPTPVGGSVVYHVVVENGDIDTVSDAVALFDLPSGASAGTLPAFCASMGGSPVRVRCDIPTLTQAASSVAFDIQMGTAAMAADTVQIHGAVGFGGHLPGAGEPVRTLQPTHPFYSGDSDTDNNQLSQGTTLQQSGDLRLVKSATPSPVIGGGEVTYTLQVFNDGPNASDGFSVVDTLPAGVSLVAGSFVGRVGTSTQAR